MRPHRRQPTRLPHPWDSPGKNAGVGCHFLHQCMKVKWKLLSCVRLLVTPWTAAHQAPPSMGFSRQEYWSGRPLPSLQMVLVVKNPPVNVGDSRDVGLLLGLGRSPGVANGTPLQNLCLENSMGREPWQATVHGAAKSQTRLSMTTGLFFGRLRDCGRQETPFLKGTHNFTWSGTQCRSNNLKGAKVRLTC